MPTNEERDILEKIREKLTAIIADIELAEELAGGEEEMPDGIYRPCLQCEKPNRKLTRGLCGKCYSRTKSAVKRKVITLDEVIAKGLWLTEAQRTGRKMKAPTKLDELIYGRAGVELPTVQDVQQAPANPNRKGTLTRHRVSEMGNGKADKSTKGKKSRRQSNPPATGDDEK
jgi:hypothetical protein